MKQNHKHVFFIACISMLFLLSSVNSGVVGILQAPQQDSSTKDTVIVSCVVGGRSTQKQLSIDSCKSLQQLFSTVIEANAVDPCGQRTRTLKTQFIEMLGDLGLLAHTSSVEEVCSLIEPPWSHTAVSRRWGHLIPPRSSDEDNATLFFCSMAGAGWGFVIPPFMLPRPRLFMQWRGFYPDSSAVSVAEMATGRGVIARGTQVGTAFGFIGVGFAFAFPGAPAQFGFLGYSLMTTLQGADMTWYYANFPPLVMQVSPEDGAVDVPVSLSELRFTLKDYDFDKMTYSVVTSPDIGSGSDANVGNGEYSIPVNNLDSGTTYTWTVMVSDGTETVEEMFSFTTEAVAPVVSNPIPANGEKDVPMDITLLQFTLMDPQGDAMEYTVETSPDVGSRHEIGVHDGTFTVPVSGLAYGITYRWFVNVTDGVHWTRKIFTFETGYPSEFNPFDFGWSYRKQITINHTKVLDDFIDFSVLISATDANLSQKTQTDGGDIMFMNDIGISTRVYHDLESYETSSGKLITWVKIPFLSSTEDTVFYMYYGNPDCINQADPEKTWDSNYEAVWHMNDASVMTIADSTSHQYTGTKIAPNGPQEFIGKIGSSQDFDGSDDCVDFIASIIPIGPKTISFWMKKHTNNPAETIFASSTGGSWNDEGTATYYEPSNVGVDWYIGNGATYGQFLSIYVPIPDTTQWHLYTMTYDGNTLTVFTDATSPLSNSTKSGTESNPSHNLRIGKRPQATYCPFHGILDEFKISNIARSYEYIATEYNNQNSPSTFLIVGPEEP